jgi:hypothetical protein
MDCSKTFRPVNRYPSMPWIGTFPYPHYPPISLAEEAGCPILQAAHAEPIVLARFLIQSLVPALPSA